MGIDTTMYAVVPQADQEEINKWAYELAVCFPGHVWHDKKDNHRALRLARFSDVNVPTDHMVLEVQTLMRYYGVGYERGPLPTILMIAEYLEIRLGATVYYGGDHNVYPFPAEERIKLFKHFCDVTGRTPYDKAFTHNTPPICEFDKMPMHETTSGPYDRHVYECPACEETKTIDNNPSEIQASYASWVSNTNG